MRRHLLAKLFFIISYILLIIIRVNGRQRRCLEEERKGLLEFKAFAKSPMLGCSFVNNSLLPSWVDDPKSDCCHWERVTCNSTTGHVTELFLDNIWEANPALFQGCLFRWNLNISLFQPFKELTSLKLSSNSIEGFVQNAELSVFDNLESLHLSSNWLNASLTLQDFSTFGKLKLLDLSDNFSQGTIPPSIIALSSLETLSLSGNGLNGALPIPGICGLRRLQHLDLSFNELGGGLPPCLRNLTFLRLLDLHGNYFHGELIPFPMFLQHADLSYNQFQGSFPLFGNGLNGTLPIPDICGLRRLQHLDLSFNDLEGGLPPCLRNLTSLRLLDLHGNHFHGELIPFPMSLQYTDLSSNQFQGSFSLSSLANCSNLEVFVIDSNENSTLQVDVGVQDWEPLFQLKALSLPNCSLRNMHFLLNQHRLRLLDLSHNNLKAEFPSWMLGNNSELEVLILKNNFFSGRLQLPPHPSRYIAILDLSYNLLDESQPENLGVMLPNLEYLVMLNNSFEGVPPASIGTLRNLVLLDLSLNNFSGEIPEELVTGCTKLEVLKLSKNKFSGIFSSRFNLTELSWLDLSHNQFTGSLWNVKYKSLLQLQILDISNNNMRGKLPASWISNVYKIVDMRNNSFEGHFPCGEILSLEYVDVSHNLLSGALPTCFDPEAVNFIKLEGNNFTGPIPTALFNLSSLWTLDLMDNKLSGRIPCEIDRLSNLRVLSLGKNQLSGLIPESLCRLTRTRIMDLSSNSLSGPLPSCLHNISSTIMGNEMESFTVSLSAPLSFETILYDIIHHRDYVDEAYSSTDRDVEINFVTKSRSLSYAGNFLNYMFGLDFSCNNLTGRIPRSLGNLSHIHALNLSHNQLTGLIPDSFSNLSQIESLDLSYNNLNGEIPSSLMDLNFLEVFSVAYNNLSGSVPDTKGQFGTFESSSYDGNPFLCGELLNKSCTSVPNPSESLPKSNEDKRYEVDFVSFSASFSATYVVLLLSLAAVLLINPYWRRRWFNCIEACMDSWSYYFFLIRLKYRRFMLK